MDRSKPITRDDVKAAIEVIESMGRTATVEQIRAHLGRGSLTTILKHRSALKKPQGEVVPDDKAMASFASLWRLAHVAGAASRLGEISGLRSDIEAVTRECGRLEDEAAAAAKRSAEAEGRLAKTMEELGQAKAEARLKSLEVESLFKKLADSDKARDAERKAAADKAEQLVRENARLQEKAAGLAQKLNDLAISKAKRPR